MGKKNNKFESRVHISLLLMIFSLLFLNFVSNYTLYRARTATSEETFNHLRTTALRVSRVVQDNFPQPLTAVQIQSLKKEFNLSGILQVSSRPADDTPEAKRQWLMTVVSGLPSGQIPEIAEKILTSEFNSMTKGRGSEYFYVYPIPARAGRDLLILSVNQDSLAYLEDSTNLILGVVVAALLLVTFLYLLISRTIFSPYRRIAEQAVKAGRPVNRDEDEIDALVADYEKMITELKQSKAELIKLNEVIRNRAESLEQFNQYLLESSNSGIITLDQKGNILSVNSAAANILGIVPADYVARHYTELFRSERLLTNVLAAALGEGVISGYREFNYTTGKNIRRILGMTVSLIKDNRQEQVGVSILLNDLTEIHRLREELETKHRLAALGEMAAGLAHQLRNSMGAISGYGQLLKKKIKIEGQPPNSIEALLQETHEAEQMINQFLTFTRPFHYQPAYYNFNELLSDLAASFRIIDNYRNIELTVPELDDIVIFGDALLMKQALGNILDNACNAYSERKGKIIITARVEADNLVVGIEDFGCGIEPENRDKIFTPFFSTRAQGTGLGLPLAGKIINLHGGRILVDSQPGKGTVFTIYLPLKETFSEALKATPLA